MKLQELLHNIQTDIKIANYTEYASLFMKLLEEIEEIADFSFDMTLNPENKYYSWLLPPFRA